MFYRCECGHIFKEDEAVVKTINLTTYYGASGSPVYKELIACPVCLSEEVEEYDFSELESVLAFYDKYVEEGGKLRLASWYEENYSEAWKEVFDDIIDHYNL